MTLEANYQARPDDRTPRRARDEGDRGVNGAVKRR